MLFCRILKTHTDRHPTSHANNKTIINIHKKIKIKNWTWVVNWCSTCFNDYFRNEWGSNEREEDKTRREKPRAGAARNGDAHGRARPACRTSHFPAACLTSRLLHFTERFCWSPAELMRVCRALLWFSAHFKRCAGANCAVLREKEKGFPFSFLFIVFFFLLLITLPTTPLLWIRNWKWSCIPAGLWIILSQGKLLLNLRLIGKLWAHTESNNDLFLVYR